MRETFRIVLSFRRFDKRLKTRDIPFEFFQQPECLEATALNTNEPIGDFEMNADSETGSGSDSTQGDESHPEIVTKTPCAFNQI